MFSPSALPVDQRSDAESIGKKESAPDTRGKKDGVEGGPVTDSGPTCAKCRTKNMLRAEYCMECGHDLRRKCGSCDRRVPLMAVVCPFCKSDPRAEHLIPFGIPEAIATQVCGYGIFAGVIGMFPGDTLLARLVTLAYVIGIALPMAFVVAILSRNVKRYLTRSLLICVSAVCIVFLGLGLWGWYEKWQDASSTNTQTSLAPLSLPRNCCLPLLLSSALTSAKHGAGTYY